MKHRKNRTMAGVALEDRLRSLHGLGSGELVERWVELHGAAPPKTLSRDLLIRGIAYNLQEEEISGLTVSEKRALVALAEGAAGAGPSMLKPGTRLYREWQGVTHEVLILEHGYGWRDRTFGSLSQVARAITGTRWSGPRFFGVKP